MRHRRRNSSAARTRVLLWALSLRPLRPLRPLGPRRASTAPVPTNGRATTTCATVTRFTSTPSACTHQGRLSTLLSLSGITQASGLSVAPLFFHGSVLQVFHSSQLVQKLSWLQAHLFCQRHGANLLSISGHEEEQFVLKVLHEVFGWVRASLIVRDVMMIVVVVMTEVMVRPTGSQRNMSSTGFGSD